MPNANAPLLGSMHIAGVRSTIDGQGNTVYMPCLIAVDDTYTPPRLIIELPDRSLRDLGIVTVDGATNIDGGLIYYNGTAAGTPTTAIANVAASQTDNAFVSAVASKKIRVLAAIFVAGGTATNVTFNTKPGGAGTAITPTFASAANGGACLPFNPVGWFDTNTGEGLTVTTGAGSTTGILVRYVTV